MNHANRNRGSRVRLSSCSTVQRTRRLPSPVVSNRSRNISSDLHAFPASEPSHFPAVSSRRSQPSVKILGSTTELGGRKGCWLRCTQRRARCSNTLVGSTPRESAIWSAVSKDPICEKRATAPVASRDWSTAVSLAYALKNV